MRILLITAGSRGDVEPFAALARRARSAGHDVRLALPDQSGVEVAGIDTVSLEVDYSALIADQGVSPLAAMRSFSTVVRPIMRAVIVNAVRAALDYRPDVIVYHPKILSAPVVADRLGVPHVLVELVPAVTPTAAFPAPGTITANLGRLNRLTYAAAQGAARMFGRELDEARRLAGSSSRSASAATASLVPISPQVLPRPDDWPATVHLTGAWVEHASRRSPADAELAEFLTAGDAVYAGFGSMAIGDPLDRGRALIAAARETGNRLLVATGWGGIAVPDDLASADILVRASVDHAAVLPSVRAAIHHGGIGTVHAAARAGIPSVVVPFFADQPFWGAQVHRQGLGPAPIPQRSLTARALVEALRAAPAFTESARAAREGMAREDGLEATLDVLEHLG